MIGWSVRGRGLRRLSDDFARRLGGAPDLVAGSLVGLEHEYLVRRGGDGRRINFAQLIHRLAPSQRGLDPADANAYWLPTGTIVTADETEAELALPPTATRPGFTRLLVERAAAAERWLAGAVGPGFFLAEGVSTHISVAIPALSGAAVAENYARRWSPAMMLLLDDADSPGLLVRPRPGRLELCGEFVRGDDLRAASLFALASTLACLAEVSSRGRQLPALRLKLRFGDQRYGWYVDRRAGGSDLYAEGRTARLMTIAGRSLTADDLLNEAWSSARPRLTRHAEGSDIDLIDRLVDGRTRLRVERPAAEGVAQPGSAPGGNAVSTAFGRALDPRARQAFEMAPVMLTWQLAVFVIASRLDDRRAFAAVPARMLGRFLRRLDAGMLDETIGNYLGLRPSGRALSGSRHLESAGLFDSIAVRPALLAPELAVLTPGAAA